MTAPSKRSMPTRKPGAAARADAALDGEPDRDLQRAEDQLILQMLASAMGLPRICVYKTCRRRKRCCGPPDECAAHHRRLVRKRIKAAIKLISGKER